MLSVKNKPLLVVIVGPTAVGKTDLSIEIAGRLNGEIISADSRLLYRGMDIGTAKPTLAERRGIPHYLIDVANPDEVWSLATYQEAAKKCIDMVDKKGKLPILVGGTGQYVHALIQGWEIPPLEPDLRMRNVLEDWGKEIGAQALHEKLKIIDPDAAGQIQYQNMRRTVRALEVIFSNGCRFSAQRKRGENPYRHILVGLRRARPELYERIDLRIDQMLRCGFVEETRQLLDRGYSPELSTLSAIGYREMIAYLRGGMELAEAVTRMKRLTRQFVRRQANWFSESDSEISWFDMDQTVTDRVEKFLRGKIEDES